MDFDDELGSHVLTPGRDYPTWFPIVGGDDDGVFFDLPGLPKWSPWKEKGGKPVKSGARGGLGDLGAIESESALRGFFKVAAVVGVGIALWSCFAKPAPRRRRR